MFYTAFIERILRFYNVCWFANTTEAPQKSLRKAVMAAGKLLGVSLLRLDDIYTDRTLRKAKQNKKRSYATRGIPSGPCLSCCIQVYLTFLHPIPRSQVQILAANGVKFVPNFSCGSLCSGDPNQGAAETEVFILYQESSNLFHKPSKF